MPRDLNYSGLRVFPKAPYAIIRLALRATVVIAFIGMFLGIVSRREAMAAGGTMTVFTSALALFALRIIEERHRTWALNDADFERDGPPPASLVSTENRIQLPESPQAVQAESSKPAAADLFLAGSARDQACDASHHVIRAPARSGLRAAKQLDP